MFPSGFYEWQSPNDGPKQPYRIYREDDPVAMAGFWEEWQGNRDEPLRTVTILTTDPNDGVESIHDRMPVVLPREDEETWLMADSDEREELCQPYPGEDLDAYPVSTAVNNLENDNARIIESLGNEQSNLGEFA